MGEICDGLSDEMVGNLTCIYYVVIRFGIL